MPTSALDFFNTSSESNDHGASYWDDISDVKDDTRPAEYGFGFGNTDTESEYIYVSSPKSGVGIPVDATVNSIRIEVRGWVDTTSTPCTIQNLLIQGGSAQAAQTLNTNQTTDYIFEGDLAYWGLTNAQALDFIAGNIFLQLRTDVVTYDGSDLIYVDWVKASFTYNEAVPSSPSEYDDATKIRRSNDSDLRRQITDALNLMVRKNGGGGGDINGQVITGNLVWYDSADQRSNPMWVQENDFRELGGFSVLDYDVDSGVPPTIDNIVAVLGMTEDPQQPGAKIAGVFFNQPSFRPVIATGYTGYVQLQCLRVPIEHGVTPFFTWPNVDGAPGSTLTTNGSGSLYWTDPPTEPNLITDTDNTDVSMTIAGQWVQVPVTVTATQPSIPAQVSVEMILQTAANNQAVNTRMQVDGVTTGQIYNDSLPRNTELPVNYSWSPTLPNGNEVITIWVQRTGNQTCYVLGTSEPTVLTLLEPGGVAAAAAQNTDFVITNHEFWGRFLDTEKEDLAKVMNRQNIGGGPPSWLDVMNVTLFVSLYAAQNVNLLEQDTIDHVNELETLGVLAPGRAAAILTP